MEALVARIDDLVGYFAKLGCILCRSRLESIAKSCNKTHVCFFLFFPSFTQTLLSDIDFASEIGKLTSLLHIASTKRKPKNKKRRYMYKSLCSR
jgi:hypothetical protein